MINFDSIDKSWTLFLDRDGVINKEKIGGYVQNTDEFFFDNGVLQALEIFNKHFGVIVIVTNQKGVGKGLMTLDDLNNIHVHMMDEINASGGRVDKIYYSTDLDDYSPGRKPQPGMAYKAKEEFSQIDFQKSIMVGNRLTDMQFGRNAGMVTVFIATTDPEISFPHPLMDARFDNLLSFAMQFQH
jgi:D-glycero-D-manno-heptose 1,7-bisphosphate phosphatase